jgi:hypothetical protein
MSPIGPPPAQPQAMVIFEDRISPDKNRIVSYHHLNFATATVCGTMRVTVSGDMAIATLLNPVNGAGELYGVYTSLRKRAQQEKMSALDTEYPW